MFSFLFIIGIILLFIGFYIPTFKNKVTLLVPRTIQEGQGLYNEDLPVNYILDTLNSNSNIQTELSLNKWKIRDYLSEF